MLFRSWENREQEKLLCIDTREWSNAEPYVGRHPDFWKNIPQGQIRNRQDEIPKDRKVVLVCNSGARSYESQVILHQAGIMEPLNLQGGMGFIKELGLDPKDE